MADKNENGSGKNWPDDYELQADCGIRGSNLCWRFADGGGCGTCTMAAVKKDRESAEARERWDETLALLPREIDTLAQGDTCLLCGGDDAEPADGYALLEMANIDPYYEKGVLFGYGKKVRSPVGSLVSVPIRVGRRCRRAYRMVEAIQICWPILMFLLSLLLLAVPQIGTPMGQLSPLLPVAFVVLMVTAGYYLGRNLSLFYVERHQKDIRFDPARIPLIQAMLSRGWYFFQVNHGMPRLTFSRTKPQGRLFPPPPAEE